MTRHLPSHQLRNQQAPAARPRSLQAQSSSSSFPPPSTVPAVDEPAENPAPQDVDLLILGAGWTSSFLIPLLNEKWPDVRWAATTRNGRDGTIPFPFDPESSNIKPYNALPRAPTVLITFPLKGVGQSRHLLKLYWKAYIDTELKRN